MCPDLVTQDNPQTLLWALWCRNCFLFSELCPPSLVPYNPNFYPTHSSSRECHVEWWHLGGLCFLLLANMWPSGGSDLANRSGPPKSHHSTWYVGRMNVSGVCQIWATTFSYKEKVALTWNCSQQGLLIILSNWVMVSERRHRCWDFQMYFGAIWFHYNREKAVISAADLSKTRPPTEKQSRWINSTTGKRKNMYC